MNKRRYSSNPIGNIIAQRAAKKARRIAIENQRFFIRPGCGLEKRLGEELGPFKDFVQISYDELKAGPDSKVVARMAADGRWFLTEEFGNPALWWSDFMISMTSTADVKSTAATTQAAAIADVKEVVRELMPRPEKKRKRRLPHVKKLV